jgi:hypothetical protein
LPLPGSSTKDFEMNERTLNKITRGLNRATEAQTRRDQATKAKPIDTTVITDIKTVIGYSTMDNPDAVVAAYMNNK